MTKLLSAEIRKCFSGVLFWLICLFAVVMALSFNVIQYLGNMEKKAEVYNDSVLYVGLTIVPILAAIFTAYFVGTEFAEGTIRNKIITGYTKTEIYICELIVCETAMIIIQYLFFISIFVFSNMFFGAFHHPFSLMIKLQLLGTLGVIEMTALILAVSMISMNKALSIVVCMGLAAALFVIGLTITNMINEHYNELIDLGEDAITKEQYDTLMAHSYVYGVDTEHFKGGKLMRCEFLYDYLPQCQTSRYIYERSVPYHWQDFVLYDAVTTIATTFVGVFLFRRTKLK